VIKAKAELHTGNSSFATIDQAILRYLAVNPHASKAVLAQQVNISVSIAASRMQALQSRNAVRIRPVLNIKKADRIFVFCKLAINTTDLCKTLENISSRREFCGVASTFGGRFNALVYFTYADMGELHDIISNIIYKIEGLVEMETSIVSESLVFKPEYLEYSGQSFLPNVADKTECLRIEASRCGLDDLDISIIAEMQSDDRKSIRAIARDYGINPGTVRYRVRKMETEGVIQFVAVIDHNELGLGCFVFVEMRIAPGAASGIVSALSSKPWLGHLFEVVGASDLIAFVNARDMADAQAIVSSEIRALPGVKAISVGTLMAYFKADSRWGFPATRV
jgi:Lrp/AsnC family transcriptional regulator, regulator for asnA, asnC and gidA